MWPFKRSKPYTIKVAGDSVYVSWERPLPEWDQRSQDEYLPDLEAAVRSTISDEIYEIISSGDMWSDPKAKEYVERVKRDLTDRFGLPEKAVRIGHYHMNMLVLGFDADRDTKYPYFYKGIQLKPAVAEQGTQPDVSGAG